MKRFILIAALSLWAGIGLQAQNVDEPVTDETALQLDTLIMSKSVFEVMPSNVRVRQSGEILSALESQIEGNSEKQFNGYRVRLYLGSSQSARSQSADVLKTFKALYPNIPAYRVYNSPNFRVVAGNFRTRLEAEHFVKAIKGRFPSAAVMRDKFKYPAIGHVSSVAVDTVFNTVPLKEE